MEIKQTKEGFWIVEGDTHISKWVEETGKLCHDEFLPKLACEYITEGATVFDCGANIGDHTVAYSDKAGKNGMVMAIEPGELAFECLCKNKELFPNDNVFAMQIALSDVRGEKLLFELNPNLGASVCKASLDGPMLTSTIDGIMYTLNLDRLDFVKMDIEGFEPKALLGARLSIANYRPVMLIEMNSEALKAQGSSYQEIFDFLKQYNYSWRIVQPQCKETDPQFDILALP